MKWRWWDSTPFHLLAMPEPGAGARRLETGVHGPQIEQLAVEVERLTKPDEIVWSNAPYAGGWIAALTRRALASLMLDEVPALGVRDPIRSAHLVLWFKMPPLVGGPTMEQIRHGALVRVGETELAVLFRNPDATTRARTPRAIIPLGIALGGVAVSLGLIVWDLRRPRHTAEKPV